MHLSQTLLDPSRPTPERSDLQSVLSRSPLTCCRFQSHTPPGWIYPNVFCNNFAPLGQIKEFSTRSAFSVKGWKCLSRVRVWLALWERLLQDNGINDQRWACLSLRRGSREAEEGEMKDREKRKEMRARGISFPKLVWDGNFTQNYYIEISPSAIAFNLSPYFWQILLLLAVICIFYRRQESESQSLWKNRYRERFSWLLSNLFSNHSAFFLSSSTFSSSPPSGPIHATSGALRGDVSVIYKIDFRRVVWLVQLVKRSMMYHLQWPSMRSTRTSTFGIK